LGRRLTRGRDAVAIGHRHGQARVGSEVNAGSSRDVNANEVMG
jgi:hypothetical protein